MNLIAQCEHCEEEIYLPSNAKSKEALREEYGSDQFQVQCTACKQSALCNTQDITARPSARVILGIGILAFLLYTVLAVFSMLASVASLAIPLIYWKLQEDACTRFNESK